MADTTNYIDVKLLIDASILPKEFSGILNIKYSIEDDITASVPVQFALLNNPKTFEGHLLISKNWKEQRIFLSFTSDGFKYTARRAVDFSKDENIFHQDAFIAARKSQKNLKLQRLAALAMLIFVVAYILGIGSHALFSSPSTTPQDSTLTAAPEETVTETQAATASAVQTQPASPAPAKPAAANTRKWVVAKDGLYYCKDNGGKDTNCIYAQRVRDTASLRIHIERGKHKYDRRHRRKR